MPISPRKSSQAGAALITVLLVIAIVSVIAVNLGDTAIEITHGMRVAQMVIAPVIQAEFYETETLDETSRGRAGFGSTGNES